MLNGNLPGNGPFEAVLFDLDGTLVDTAPDMVATLLHMQQLRGDDAIDYDLARSHVSNGAVGLVRLAFGGESDALQADLKLQFLQHYQERVCQDSCVFPGLEPLLDTLDQGGHPFGVVTNKPQALTDALLLALQLSRRLACAICGDTLPERKPHPAPMLLASRQIGIAPERIIYVGDAARDIEAGQAAGMATIGAAWGYITSDDDPARWNADAVAATPDDLTQMLRNALG